MLKSMLKKRHNLLIFTAARSDFGILRNTIERSLNDKRFDTKLIINPAHKSKIFGETINEISKKIKKKSILLNFNYKSSKKENILDYFSKIIKETNIILKKNNSDSALILGDRYEMLAFAFCCLNHKIPIVHLCGGSETLGSLDNIYRYSISKMSKIHLVETSNHKSKLKKLGINQNIHIVGAPGLENLIKKKNIHLTIEEIKFLKSYKKKIIACFHPETNTSIKKNIYYLNIFIKFLIKTNQKIIFTYPNADEGFNKYLKVIKNNTKKSNINLVSSLGIDKYYYMLNRSDLIIGNSSSGIIESCSFKIPCINLGKRQKNRFSPRNVLHSPFNLKSIKQTYNYAMSKKFIKKVKKLNNPYFNKDSSKNILDLIYKSIKI